MENPFFSIIIPVYNVEKYIRACLESVFDQDIEREHYEVIVVNDGTPDNSMKIVKEYEDKFSNLKTINKENGGVSSARNAGIDSAIGKYILFIDPDDFITENSLLKIYNQLTQKESEIVIFNSFEIVNDEKILKYPFPLKYTDEIFTGTEMYTVYNRGSVCGVAFERDFLKKHDLLFDEKIINGEDALFFSFCLVTTNFIYHYDIDVYVVRRRSGSASQSWTYERIKQMSDTLISIKDFKREKLLNDRQKAILNYRAYLTISNMLFQFVKLYKFSKYFDLKGSVKQTATLPISTKYIEKSKWKIKFLNFSFGLFYLVFQVRQTFSHMVKFLKR